MPSTSPAAMETDVQDRLTVARWPHRRSLEARLALFVTLSVAAVIGVLTVVGLSVAERRIEDDLRETARVTAVAVADDFELQPDPRNSDAIARVLHDFMSAAPSLQSITVFRQSGSEFAVLASTSSVPAPPEALITRALHSREPVWQDRTPHVATVAVLAFRDSNPIGVVVVTVSLAPVEHFRSAGRLTAFAGTMAAIAGITLLIHLLARRLILAPLQEIRRAMARVGAGEMAARAKVTRRDELGELAAGLNRMLTELEDLHRSLHDRVAHATEQLRERNEQLVRSYESVLELRETVARARQLAAVGQTMANLAHQIGTPLNLVSGHVQLLRQLSDDPALQRRLRIIDEQVERVAMSVRQVLDRARPQADRRPVDVGAVLTRLAEAMRPRLEAAGVTIATAIDAVPTIVADETQLELALVNVMTNAVDAMSGGGTLTIRVVPSKAAPGESGAHIEIADTGSGIPAQLLSRIFEPWLTTKLSGRGVGLGLSITRDVVTSLGGTIAARSAPGEGSTFIIDLPAPVAAGVHES